MNNLTAYIKKQSAFRAIDRLSERADATRLADTYVAAFYYFVLYLAFSSFFGLHLLLSRPVSNFDPAAILFWAAYVPYDSVAVFVVAFFLFGAFVGALGYRLRTFRIVALLGILQYHAFISSFGARDHGWILIGAVAFFFVLLPALPDAESVPAIVRKKFLAAFWAATAFLFMVYMLAGTGKLIVAFEQLFQGQVSSFSFQSAALHVADWSIQTGSAGLLSAFVVTHPFIGWLGHFGIMCLQLSCFIVVFFPRLYRVWGVLLLSAHLAIFLAMDIAFVEPAFLIALFLFASPLALRFPE